MYSDEQEKLIECFNGHTAGIWRRWPETRELLAPYNIRPEDIYRKLYARLAPEEPLLPACWSHKMTVVSRRGDGMLETNETLFMPSAEKEYTYELLVAGVAYVKTKFSDRDAEDSPWVFTVHAPATTALERAVEELAQLLPPMPERKILVTEDKEEVFPSEKAADPEASVYPKLIMRMMPGIKAELSALKEYLEKLPGITGLKYDFLYNLAECHYEYENVCFDYRTCHFFVFDNKQENGYSWSFYVEGGKCPENVISELLDYCKLFGRE